MSRDYAQLQPIGLESQHDSCSGVSMDSFQGIEDFHEGGPTAMDIGESQREVLRELMRRAFGDPLHWETLSTGTSQDLLALASRLGLASQLTEEAADFFVSLRHQFLGMMRKTIEDGLQVQYGKAVEIYCRGFSIFDHNEPSHWGLGKK